MALPITKRSLIERIQRHMNNGFPDTDFKTSANEILLYIDEALAFNMIGDVYDSAKIEGVMVVPEAYYVTYELPSPTLNNITGYWETMLPQPPVGLPLGHSINNAYFASEGMGVTMSVTFIKARRVARRRNMPRPSGIFGWVEGSKFIFDSSNGQPMYNTKPFVTMVSTRTDDLDAPMNMPDDAISKVFAGVINRLKDRLNLPKDIIKDNLPAGNKSS